MQRQPLDKPLHGWDNLSFHSSILLCPGLNLLLDVISWNRGMEAPKERHKEASKGTQKKSNSQADLRPEP